MQTNIIPSEQRPQAGNVPPELWPSGGQNGGRLQWEHREVFFKAKLKGIFQYSQKPLEQSLHFRVSGRKMALVLDSTCLPRFVHEEQKKEENTAHRSKWKPQRTNLVRPHFLTVITQLFLTSKKLFHRTPHQTLPLPSAPQPAHAHLRLPQSKPETTGSKMHHGCD